MSRTFASSRYKQMFSSSARMLQSDAAAVIKVVQNDPVQMKDSTAAIPANVAQINLNEISVDGATVASAPEASQYINELSQAAAELSLSLGQSFVRSSFYALVGIFIALMI